MSLLKKIQTFFKGKKPELESSFAFVYHEKYNLDLGGHVLPAIKYEKIFHLIQDDDALRKHPIESPEMAVRSQLETVHTSQYLDDFLNCHNTFRTAKSELPLNEKIVDGFLYAVGGTILSADLLNSYKTIYNIGGGFHHSYPDHAEGFCYLNDTALSAIHILEKNPDTKILIIDLDVHQGNGTSYIFRDNPGVFTFSMHQENLYPVKEKSGLDIGLEIGIRDSEYLKILADSLEMIYKNFKPDVIFYLAGADPYEDDKLGGLCITKNGLYRRDSTVKSFQTQTGSSCIILCAGGYARDFDDTVEIHYNTAKVFGLSES